MPLKPYKVLDSGETLQASLTKNSLHCAQIQRDFNILINDLPYYRKALESLLNMKNCVVDNMRNFMNTVPENTVHVGLRHDVDHDIVTAKEMSNIEKEYNVSGSYYILHSHPFVAPSYYASFDDSNRSFLRNNCLAEVYAEMQENGSELGLHVDPIRLYQNDIDGQQAIIIELQWLRNQGLDIKGVAAHGSAPFYECENFEVFKEYWLGHSEFAHPNGHTLKLGQLSATDLGIAYEANYARKNKHADPAQIKDWLKTANNEDKEIHLYWYLHNNKYLEWGADIICWLYEEDCWAISEKNGIWNARGTLDDVLEITGKAQGQRVQWHIHPFYLGKRI